MAKYDTCKSLKNELTQKHSPSLVTSRSPSTTRATKKARIVRVLSLLLSVLSIQILFFIHPSHQGNNSWSLLSSHTNTHTHVHAHCPFSSSFWAWQNQKTFLINHSHLITFLCHLLCSYLYFHLFHCVLFFHVMPWPPPLQEKKKKTGSKAWIRCCSHEQHTPTFLVLLWLRLEPTQAAHTRAPPPPLPSIINIELISTI